MLAQICSTLCTVVVAYLVALTLTQTEGQLISGVIVYAIICYEMLQHVLPQASRFLELDSH